jgi:hypothetical protein
MARSKSLNIFIGSTFSIVSGLVIYTMLKYVGADFGVFESSLVIGLPFIMGTVTSLVIF